jgi:hypothetical protein
MSVTFDSQLSISQQVSNIVDSIVRGLVEEVQSGNIDDLETATWSAVDSLECVIYTYQAKLVATVADWDEFRDEFGADCLTPERIAFHHILREVEGDDAYQEPREKLEYGEDD